VGPGTAAAMRFEALGTAVSDEGALEEEVATGEE
jgi:hypothetical protein